MVLYPLKTPKNQRFPSVQMNELGTLARNELIRRMQANHFRVI